MSSLLLIDDDLSAVESLARALSAALEGVSLFIATDPEKALQIAVRERPAVVVLDLCLVPAQGVESGFSLLQKLLYEDPHLRIIVLTGHGDTEFGVRSMKLGASNFLVKPASIPHLSALVDEALRQSVLLKQLESHTKREEERKLHEFLIGDSRPMKELREQLRFLAGTVQPVLIEGETGVGKSLCARLLHQLSKRQSASFVRYQPGLSTSDVLASELFGHEKGAFTGAEDTREGLLLRAHGGTFFLDEIDGLPLETQTALLGVLQEKRFRRMGADTETAVDIRFITATNAEAEKLVDEGKMRSDFFHRIAHGRVYVPALRERLGDIPLLVENLSCRLEQEERIQSLEWSERAIEKLLAHQWPGNIRELEGVIEGASAHACFYGRHEVLPEDVTLHSINPRTQDAVQQSALSVEENPSPQETLHSQVALFKKNVVKRVLEENGGNQAQAARSLGIDRTTLRRILLA